MTRMLFPEDRIHPAIRDKIATSHRDIVEEVAAAIASTRDRRRRHEAGG